MKKLLATVIISLFSISAYAQEVSVGGGGTSRSSGMASQINSIKQSVQIQQNELSKIIKCNDGGKLYHPSNGSADTNGCASSPDLTKLLTCNARNKFYNPTDSMADAQGCVAPPNYSWNASGWSSCSKSCGGGTQTRSISCMRDDTSATVANAFCPAGSGSKPATSQACNTQSCTQKFNYKVRGGSGGNCKNIGNRGATSPFYLPTWAAKYTLKVRWYDHGNYYRTFTGTKAAGSNSISVKHCIHQGAEVDLTLTGR